MGETVAAKKVRMGPPEALALARTATTIVAAKGQKVQTLAVGRADDAAILALLMGPTGNLRAPTAVVGTTLLVGFHPSVYSEVLG